jgi:hypothetical protein
MIRLKNQRRTIKYRSMLSYILALTVFAAFYFISAELLSLFKYGDQIAYRLFYDRLAGVPFEQVPIIQIATLGSAEPVYGILMWAGANIGFSKDGYLSFFNGFFAAALFILMRKYRVSPVVIALIFCNFYFLVLLTSAERLKFAYIFLTLAAIFSGRIRFIFGALAFISHFQTLLNFVAMFSGSLSINRDSA